jgi:hypothetical protein
LRGDREVVLTAVQQNGHALQYAEEPSRSDRDIILAAVRNNGLALWHRRGTMYIHDEDIVMEAVSQNGDALKYVGRDLKMNRDIVLAAVQTNGLSLMYCQGTPHVHDEEIVKRAVEQNGHALEYAGEALRRVRRIVMAAIQQNGLALMHSGDTLYNDEDVALDAVEQNGQSIVFAGPRLRDAREFFLKAVKRNGMALGIQKHYEMFSKMYHCSGVFVSSSPMCLRLRNEAITARTQRLVNDEEIVRAAVENNGYSLQFASKHLRGDEEIALAATKNTWRALAFAGEGLWSDETCRKAAVGQLPKGKVRQQHLDDACIFRLPSGETTKLLPNGVWGMTVEEINRELSKHALLVDNKEVARVSVVDEGASRPMKDYMIPFPPLDFCRRLFRHLEDLEEFRLPEPSVVLWKAEARNTLEIIGPWRSR